MDPAAGRDPKQARTVVALKPVQAAGNAFAGLFSASLCERTFAKVPFQWEDLGRGAADVVLFHWPTEFFRPSSRRKTLALLAKMAWERTAHGTKFVWVAHNLHPHDGGSMASSLTASLFVRNLGGVIYLSHHAKRAAEALYPSLQNVQALVTRHGRYPAVAAPPTAHKHNAGPVRLIFFGLIRDYKNADGLAATVRALPRSDVHLTILGTAFDKAAAARVKAAAADDPRITLRLSDTLIEDAALEAAIDDHDAVVLPYRSVLNSGVALHALGRNRPILVPRIGSLPELVETVGPDFVKLYDGELTPSTLSSFCDAIAGKDLGCVDLSAHGWDDIGPEVSAFLSAVAGASTARKQARRQPQSRPDEIGRPISEYR